MSNKEQQVVLFQEEILKEHNQQLIKNVLQDRAETFTASLIEIYSNEDSLKECAPSAVIKEAMKAAVLRLPITKTLGLAYIIAYKDKPQFQIGYKGLIQLAIRSGFYENINADVIYEGEVSGMDRLKGTYSFDGTKTGDEVVGYFAHLELKNGFSKTLYMTKEQVIAHAKKYSKTFSSDYTPWKSSFDEMAIKTVLKKVIGQFGVLSVEMEEAFEKDVEEEITTNANMITVPATVVTQPKKEEKKETKKEEKKKAPF